MKSQTPHPDVNAPEMAGRPGNTSRCRVSIPVLITNRRMRGITAAVACSLFVVGCESFAATWAESFRTPSAVEAARLDEIRHLQREFRANRSPEAIRQLLAEHIESGMTLEEVRGVLGEPGERVYDDRRFKQHSEVLHVSDVMYRFGPDRCGRSYYLAFRDGTLVNFLPEDLGLENR